LTSRRVPSLIALLAIATVLLGGVLAGQADAAVRHIDGTVVSKNAKEGTFRMSTQSGAVRIRVTSTTIFERISGFGSLHKGLEIQVDAKQTSSGLLATKIEPQTHAEGGGGGGGGHDDGPNHS
jgi:uncharacterized protein DUF5666